MSVPLEFPIDLGRLQWAVSEPAALPKVPSSAPARLGNERGQGEVIK